MSVTSLLDLRPPGVNALLRPGNPATVPITWPASELDGRTFTSTLDGEPISVTVDGDVMTISATPAQTAVLEVGEPVDWLLLEDLATDEVVLTGRWVPSLDPAATQTQAFTITIVDGTITVDVSGTASLAAHKARLHIPHVTVPAAWGDHWRQARDEADSRVVRVQVWGDSISVGAGATNPLTQGWLELLSDALHDEYGDGGTGYRPWSQAATTGTWTSGIGFGGGLGTIAATGTLTFTGLRGTSIRIWHQDLATTGSFRYRVDGGSYTTVTTPAGASGRSATSLR